MIQIIDTLYFEKLSIILTKLNQWQKDKDSLIDQSYMNSITSNLTQFAQNQIEVKNQTNSLLTLVHLQYMTFHKVKKDDKNTEMPTMNPIFMENAKQFFIIKQDLIQLGEFFGKFFGVVANQLNQIKIFYNELLEIKEKLEKFRAKTHLSQNIKKQSICVKKSKKYFEMQCIMELKEFLPKQILFYSQINEKVLNFKKRNLKIRVNLYKNFADNLNYIGKLYKKIFNTECFQQLKQFYSNKIEQLQKIYEDGDEKQQQIRKKDIQNILTTNLNALFRSFLEEITIREWKVELRQIEENKSQKKEFQELNAHLTFDNKLLFLKNQRQHQQIISLQLNLADCKIKPSINSDTVIVKDKKIKVLYEIKFGTSEREDQFILHLNQIHLVKA